MNASFVGLFDQAFCIRLTETLLLFLSEGVAVAVAAFVICWRFRKASAQVRYGVHTTSLIVMALCLPVTFVLTPHPWPLDSSPVRIDILSPAPDLERHLAIEEGANANALGFPPVSTVPADAAVLISDIHVPSGEAQSPGLSFPAAADLPAAIASMSPTASPLEHALHSAAPYATGGYFAGVLLMVMRLLAAIWGGHRLRTVSQPVRDRRLLLQIRRQARRLGLQVVPVVAYCERIAIPVVAGVIKPMILLPTMITTGLDPDQLQAILTHELAHIRRFDLLVNVLQRLIETVLFFHPAVWYLSRRIDVERENCCDDVVVLAGYESLRYADALVRMAALSAAQLRPATISQLATLAANGGNGTLLKRRVLRLLGCEHQLRFRRSDSLTLLLAAVLVVATVTSVLHPASADQSPAAEDKDPAAQSDQSSDKLKKNSEEVPSINAVPIKMADDADSGVGRGTEPDNEQLHFAGTVVDPNGKLVAGATIHLCYFTRAAQPNLAPVATTNDRGEFRFTRRLDDGDIGDDDENRQAAVVVAVAPGFGFALKPSVLFETSGSRLAALSPKYREQIRKRPGSDSNTLQLIRDDVPVKGRVVNIDGQPVAGAKVEVRTVFESLSGSLQDWEATTRADGMDSITAINKTLEYIVNGPRASVVVPPTATDKEGRFVLRGLGIERIAEINFVAPGIESTKLFVRSRAGATISLLPFEGKPDKGRDTFYPAEFTHIAGPSQALVGRITNRKTGEPVANCALKAVQGWRDPAPPRPMVGDVLAITDSDGRYRLEGLPHNVHTINVTPLKSSAYFGSSFEITTEHGAEPKTRDLQLTRGVLLKGRAVDRRTKAPVAISTRYVPFPDQPEAKTVDGLSYSIWQNRTGKDGRFEIPVIPGRGILGVTANEVGFRKGLGAKEVEEAISRLDKVQQRSLLNFANPQRYDSVRLIDVPQEGGPDELTIEIESAPPIAARILSPAGEPLANCATFGHTGRQGWQRHHESTFQIEGYFPDADRRILIHEPTRNLVGEFTLKGQQPAELEFRLQPGATISGRAMNESGEPLADSKIDNPPIILRSPLEPPPTEDPQAGRLIVDADGDPLKTDADGRFRIAGIIPGLKYTAAVWGETPFRNDVRVQSLGEVFTDVTAVAGENKELGDVRPKKRSPRMPAAGTPGPLPPVAIPATAESAKNTDETLHYAGTVVDDTGLPMAGAKVSLNYWRLQSNKEKAQTTVMTGADGKFELTSRKSDFGDAPDGKPWGYAQLVATKPGHGFAAALSVQFETSGQVLKSLSNQARESLRRESRLDDNVLKLRRDMPIRGRIVDTDGRPVVGAVIELFTADEGKNGSLDDWEAETKKSGANYYSVQPTLRSLFRINAGLIRVDETIPAAKTDAEGVFVLNGLGHDRLVEAVLSGPGIESTILRFRSRKGETIKLSDTYQGVDGRSDPYYPADFTHVVGPSQTVEGVVTDLKTGKPVAGVPVRAERTATNRVGGRSSFIRAKTDADGRFRLEGFPLGNNEFVILPSAQSGYLGAGVSVKTNVGGEAAVKNVTLTPGIIARGIVTDATTGQPIRGYAEYLAFADNPELKETTNFRHLDQRHQYRTNDEGRFEIPVLPGPGVVTFWAGNAEAYPRGEGADKITRPAQGSSNTLKFYDTAPYHLVAVNCHGLMPIEPAVDSGPIDVSLTLTPSQSFSGRVVAADGTPVENYVLFAERAPGNWYEHPQSTFDVKGYQPAYGRRLMAYDRQTNSVGLLDLNGDAPEIAEIKLQPATRIVGRLVDDDGKPLAAAQIDNEIRRAVDPLPVSDEDYWRGKFDPERAEFVAIPGHLTLTDAEGRFELVGIMPGLKYSASVRGMQRIGNASYYTQLGSIFTDVIAKPGDKHDLGDVQITPPKSRMEPPTAAVSEKPLGPKIVDESITVNGSVLLPNGQPAPGATVRAMAPLAAELKAIMPAGFLPPLTEVKTDAAGRFSIRISKQPFGDLRGLGPQAQDSWKSTVVAASLAGYGAQWISGEEIDLGQPMSLTLVEDRPVLGRVIDLEGRPLVGVSMTIENLSALKAEDLGDWEKAIRAGTMAYMMSGTFDSRVPVDLRAVNVSPRVTTDRDGRFEIRGLGKERFVYLRFGDEQAAFENVVVATRPMEKIEQIIGPRTDMKRMVYGAGIVYTAMPTRAIEGTVRDARTGAALAGVAVESESFAGGRVWAHPPLTATTDQQGKFRLLGMPKGAGNIVIAYPNHEQPYLARKAEVPDATGLGPASVEIKLDRGLWVTGRVTDKATKQPVQGVRMYYMPYLTNPFAQKLPEFRDENIEGRQGRVVTGADGTYRIVGIPGPAVIGAECALQSYRVGIGFDSLPATKKSKSGWLSVFRPGPALTNKWPTSLKETDPAADAAEMVVDLELDPGATVKLAIVDEAGQPVRGCAIRGLRGLYQVPTTDDATQDVINLGPEETRIITIYQQDRRIGRVIRVTPDDTTRGQLTATLLPLGTLTGRLMIDDAPMAGLSVTATVLPGGDFSRELPPVLTDATGRFEYHLLPGAKYSLNAIGPGIKYAASITREIEVPSGETRDLGVLGLKKNSFEAVPSPPAATGTPIGDARDKGETDVVTAKGIVLLPNGEPAAGATIRVAAPVWAMMKPILGETFLTSMTETIADSKGKFSVQIATKPFGDVSRLDSTWQEIWKRTVIAASKDGFGPQWVEYGDTKPGEVVTLTLVDDQPIRGRVIDLEGRPVAGATVKIGGPRGARNEDLTAWIEGIRSGELPWTVYDKVSRSIEPRLIGLRDTTTTGADGSFEIKGLGKDRVLTVIIEGESVAHRGATLVSKTMAPIKQRISTPPFEGWQPVFGADFTFTSDPARVVEGIVKDAATGQALAGVSVESYKLVGYPYSNHRVLKTVSDSQGKFRLIGMPKGKGNRLLAIPNDDQPFFMRQVEVPDPVGLDPATMDVELHRGLWITGRVTNQSTGEGVAGVRLHYLPYLSNEHVRAIPEFDRGNVDGDQMRYVTSRDGTYRLVGMPGRAVVGAESVLTSFRSGQGYSELKEAGYGKGDRAETYRNPVNPGPKWPTAMKEIDPAADAEAVTVDFALDAGATVRLSLVDDQGKAVSGASIVGLTGTGYQKADPGPEQNIVNLGPDETRTIIIRHEARGLGRIVRVGPDEVAAGKTTAELQPTGTITGRLLKDDAPVKGAAVEFRLLPSGDFSKSLPKVATNAEGRFECTVLTGSEYTVYVEGGGIVFASLSDAITIKPGEKRDLGTLILGENRKFMSAPSALSTTNGK